MTQTKPHNTSLIEALEARLASTTKQGLARSAGVATKTLLQILNGTYPKDFEPCDPKDFTGKNATCTQRQLRGAVETLTRLSKFVGLDPKSVCKAYGIHIDWKDVDRWIASASVKSAMPLAEGSPVLTRIRERARFAFGILAWKPFTESWERMSGDVPTGLQESNVQQEITKTWAYRYMRGLLGAVNPHFEKGPTKVFRTIAGALDAVLTRNPEKQCDAVFGIYDTPFRRQLGLKFIHLPGLGVPLGAVEISSPVKSIPMTWNDIVHPSELQPLKALVIDDEAGHLFLKGICSYDENPSVQLRSSLADSPKEIAQFCISESANRAGRRVLFIADRLTCNAVREELKRVGTVTSHFVGHSRLTPVYRVGIAIRADDQQWAELLESTQTEEVFRNAHQFTADAYFDLLLNRVSHPSDILPLPFEPDLPPAVARRFSRYLLRRIAEVSSKSKNDRIDPLLKAFRSAGWPGWQKNFAHLLKRMKPRRMK